MKVEEVV
ncbi:hypothetical protein A2U01_0101694, partial [Trifolium medium]|nr:hypothetical protein [Trifolium medium]